MDWINKTWINKTWSDIARIYDQVRKGFFPWLGFIGSEYDKHDLGTMMFQRLLLSVTQYFWPEMK